MTADSGIQVERHGNRRESSLQLPPDRSIRSRATYRLGPVPLSHPSEFLAIVVRFDQAEAGGPPLVPASAFTCDGQATDFDSRPDELLDFSGERSWRGARCNPSSRVARASVAGSCVESSLVDPTTRARTVTVCAYEIESGTIRTQPSGA